MTAVTGTFTATGASGHIDLAPYYNNNGNLTYYNVTLWGTFVATVRVERSFDGVTWHSLSKDLDGNNIEFSGPVSIPLREPEAIAKYRLYCSAHTSGTVNYRLSR